jgi:hypothetical protein
MYIIGIIHGLATKALQWLVHALYISISLQVVYAAVAQWQGIVLLKISGPELPLKK